MSLRVVLGWLWRIPLIALAISAGVILGALIPTLAGVQAPPLPDGAEMNAILLYSFLGNLAIALALALLAKNLAGRWVRRWLVLAVFSWMLYVAMFIEAAIYMEPEAAGAGFNIIAYTVPSQVGAALAALLFRPDRPDVTHLAADLNTLFDGREPGEWAWRLAAILLAFPLIYLLFGLLVVPATYTFYSDGAFNLAAPPWGQIIPVQVARSVLLLFGSLGILAGWRGSRRGLYLALGFAVFVLIGLAWTISSYWLAPALRVFHTLEIAGDAFLYTAALVALIAPPDAVLSRPVEHRDAVSLPEQA